MKLRTQLLVLVLLALVGLAGLTGLAQYQLDRVFTATNFTNINSLPAIVALDDTTGGLTRLRVSLYQHLLSGDGAEKSMIEQKMAAARAEIDKGLKDYEPTLADEKDRQLFLADRAALSDYDTLREKVLSLSRASKPDEARALLMANQPVLARITDAFDEHRQYNVTLGQQAAAEAVRIQQNATSLSLVISALVLASIALVGWLTARSVMHQLGCEPAEAADFARRIAAGDLSFAVDTQGKDPNSMLVAFKGMMDSITVLAGDVKTLTAAAAELKLDVRADATRHQGDFQRIVQGINGALDAFIGPLKTLIQQIESLSGKVVDGNLAARLDTNQYTGDFRVVATGMNNTLNALVNPLNVAANYVDRIAKGDIPPKIAETYHGDFNVLKNNLNTCIDALNGLIDGMRHMSTEHDRGDIDVVMDASHFQGAYQAMAQGVNDMVNGHIAVKKKAMACIKAFGEGDFDAPLEKFPGKKAFINDTVEQVRGNIKAFIADMQHMSIEHDKGDIDVRMDVGRFQGAYRTMAQGVNDMVSGHIGVKKKAMACVKAFGEGNFDAPLEQFPGKKAFINDTIEQVRGNIRAFIADMQHMSSEHDKGDIEVFMAVDRFQGAYRTMAQGVNDMVSGHIAVKKKAMACVKAFGEGNFDAPLERFPGKKAFINDTIEQVRRNLQALIDDVNMLSEAALEGRIQTRADAGKHQGDFRKIVEGVNATLETIVAPIVVVKNAADTINTAAKEIAAGNSDLSQRTEEQASSLEETASSMEQLASTVKQNAENAKQANQMAVAASDVAGKGGAVVQRVVVTMHDINESARKIADIIGVIDGIAFQTNILALNAAVEAARAGEQGRGFAVVAGEVRNLAQRSAAAAKEIKTLIGDSVDKVEGGSKLVEEAGKTMTEVVTAVQRMTDIMSEISAASAEQSRGIDQVNMAITQMDEVTQQNAALVEQASAAALSLEEQAQNLSNTVAQFRIDSEGYYGAQTARTQAVVPSSKPVLAARTGKRPAPSRPKAVMPSKLPALSNSDDGDWNEF